MSGFEINLGVAGYAAAHQIAMYIALFLAAWSVWGLYTNRKDIGAEVTRIEASDDNTLVDLIGFKPIKRTIWKVLVVSIILIFFKSGIVKLVEDDATTQAREAMTYAQEVKRVRVPIKTNAEIKAAIEARKVADRLKIEQERAKSLEAAKAKNKEIINDSFDK